MHHLNRTNRLEYRRGADCDGALRLTLLGEVDIAVAAELVQVLAQLEHARSRVRLDLSELQFIDLAGLDAILLALARARRSGWELEVDPCISPAVRRIIWLTDMEALLWPPPGPQPRPRPRCDQARSERPASCSASSPGSQP